MFSSVFGVLLYWSSGDAERHIPLPHTYEQDTRRSTIEMANFEASDNLLIVVVLVCAETEQMDAQFIDYALSQAINE
ncbi:MAG TPA: hypothetical protein VKB76_20415 [Ktedonobacterales bacterium]|nr:hypothetical protein [Ktedonobacterales bacterium]